VPRARLIEAVRDILAKTGFYVSERPTVRGLVFDVVARRDEVLTQLEATSLLAPLPATLREEVLAQSGGDALDSITAAFATARAFLAPDAFNPPTGDLYATEGYVYV